MVSSLRLGWSLSFQGTRNDFRIAGRFAIRRNAVVLLSGVSQIQELAEGTGYRQQFVVRQILQRGQQLLAVSFVAGA